MHPAFFVDALLDREQLHKAARQEADFIISAVAHGVVFAVIVLAPSYFTADIDFESRRATQLIGQPAPAPLLAKPITVAKPLFVVPDGGS